MTRVKAGETTRNDFVQFAHQVPDSFRRKTDTWIVRDPNLVEPEATIAFSTIVSGKIIVAVRRKLREQMSMHRSSVSCQLVIVKLASA